MSTICSPLVADLFCFAMKVNSCCLLLTINNQTEYYRNVHITSSYLDDILNIDHYYFMQMARQIYSTDNNTNTVDTDAYILDK